MIEINEDELIVCAEPDCSNQIKKGTVFYFVEDGNGEARAICADCRMKKMNILESAFAAKKDQRDEAHERAQRAQAEECLRNITAELSRLTCAKKEIA